MSATIQRHLQNLHQRYASLDDGEVATYIPELAKADPNHFGICIATTDGRVYTVGEAAQTFTIQSISKPFVYGLAMEDRGREAVGRSIGVEPTGDAFNSISLEPVSGRPLNPMINAGAIAASALIKGHTDADRQDRLLQFFSRYAGRALQLDEATYVSEKQTGHRNRAIGHMLRNFGILDEDPERALDLYFRQCSILVDCRDLALMAASLANGGVHPITRERTTRADLVGPVLSVMSTCGMYDFAGQWMDRVGLPAKSGVAGGVLAVVPGQLGIAVYSPRLDARGNSVRGIRVCEDLARDMGLHFLASVPPLLPPIHSRATLRGLRSKRNRPLSEQAVLDRSGDRVSILKLQGALRYATAERVLREVEREDAHTAFVVLDGVRVSHVDPVAERLLIEACIEQAQAGRTILFSGLHAHAGFQRRLEEALAREEGYSRVMFDLLDDALERCEDALIEAAGSGDSAAPVELRDHALCEGLSTESLRQLREWMREERYDAGDLVVRRGEAADRLFLLAEGEAGVFVTSGDGRRRRMATIPAGSGFGEAATLLGGTRSADIHAETPMRCWTLTREALATLEQSQPALAMALLRNLLRSSLRATQRMTEEVAFLEGDLMPRLTSAAVRA